MLTPNDKLLMLKNRLANITYENIVDMAWWNNINNTAKMYNALVVFPASDDLLCTAGYDQEEYSAWEGTTLFVCDNGITDDPVNIDGALLFTVTSVWVAKGDKAWAVITTAVNNSVSFDIYEDGEVWANGLIIDMESYCYRGKDA